MTMFGCCSCGCSQVRYIRQPVDPEATDEELAEIPWNKDNSTTVTLIESEEGTTLPAGSSIKYSISTGCTNFSVKVQLLDNGIGNGVKPAGYNGYKIKVNECLQTRLKGQSLTEANAVGTPLENNTGLSGNDQWRNKISYMTGSDYHWVNLREYQTDIFHYFCEGDVDCCRVGCVTNENGIASYERIPPRPSRGMTIEVTITAGDDDIDIGEVSYITGNTNDLQTYHSDYFKIGGIPEQNYFFRESIEALFDIPNPVTTLTTGGNVGDAGYPANGCSGAWRDINFEYTSQYDNTQFSGTHPIKLYFSQRFADHGGLDIAEMYEWPDAAEAAGESLTNYQDALDQFRDLSSLTHEDELLDYDGYCFFDKEMDKTTQTLTWWSSSDKTANDSNTTHTDPADYIGQYLSSGLTYATHRGIPTDQSATGYWCYIYLPNTCDVNDVSDHYATDYGIVLGGASNNSSRKFWLPREYDYDNSRLKIPAVEAAAVGASVTYDETYKYGFASTPYESFWVGAGAHYVVDYSDAYFGLSTLDYTHTIFKQRNYSRYDSINDHCPTGYPNDSISSVLNTIYLKDDALSDIKLYDTDGTTLLFEASTIYHDPSKPYEFPSDSFTWEGGLDDTHPNWNRQYSGLMLMDGINDYDGTTWGIYLPTGSFQPYERIKITDFAGTSYTFSLTLDQSGWSNSYRGKSSWEIKNTNGAGNVLNARYYR